MLISFVLHHDIRSRWKRHLEIASLSNTWNKKYHHLMQHGCACHMLKQNSADYCEYIKAPPFAVSLSLMYKCLYRLSSLKPITIPGRIWISWKCTKMMKIMNTQLYSVENAKVHAAFLKGRHSTNKHQLDSTMIVPKNNFIFTRECTDFRIN